MASISRKQRADAGAGIRPWTITPRDVADFKRAMELLGDGPAVQRSIELHRDPVHCDEYRAVRERLDRSFDIPLWIDDVLLIECWRPPADHDLAEYERAYAIRRELERASGTRKPQDGAGKPVVRPSDSGLSDSQKAAERTVAALKAECLPDD